MNDIRVAELFAGIGGFRLGLETAKARSDIWRYLAHIEGQQPWQQSYRVVWANEIDKHACQIYRKNFGEKELVEGDIRKIEADDIPDIDMLVGGFPCQPFSMAGKRQGFADFRGTLFFEIARILESKRPQTILLENVRGLLSAQNGFCFWAILNRLDELGYNVEWKVLNTANWLPQTRERVFIVGHHTKNRGSRSQIFPFTSYDEADKSEGASVNTLTGGGHSGGLHSNMTAILPCLTPNRPNKRQNGRRLKEDGEPMFTLTAQDVHGVVISKTIRSGGRGSLDRHSWDVVNEQGRRLTEIDEERLQGFPDNWTQGVSQTQRYKMLGNAVSVPVIRYIGELILEALD